MIKRKQLIYLVSLLVFGIVCYGGYYYLTTTPLVVDFGSVSRVEVIEKSSQKKIAKLDSATSSTRIKKGDSFTLQFTGKEDYANGKMDIKASDSMPIRPKPYYSEKKLTTILNTEQEAIDGAINNFLSVNNAVYSKKILKLYHRGDLCGVVLKYNGEYSFQSDDIRLLLQKKDGVWVAVTAATLSLGQPDYPNLPFDILSDLNRL